MSESPGPHIHCPRCGYDLTGLGEPRCPECGEGFAADALQQELTLPRTNLGMATLRILVMPLASTIAGLLVGLVGSADKTGGMAILLAICLAISLLVVAILLSRKLARQLGVSRALRLGIAPFGHANRRFILAAGIGLFCCQFVLAAGGFVGGCACTLLSNANFH